MYFTINKRNILLWGSMLCVLCSYKIMNLPMFSSIAVELTYVSWMLALFLSVYLYKDIIRINKNNVFLRFYFTYIILSQIIISVFSMYTYDENIIDILICCGCYFLILFVYILLIGMEEYGTKEFLKYFYIFGVIYMIILLINALSVNYLGIQLIIGQMASKTGYMRASAGSLYVVLMITLFWRILCGEKTKNTIICFILGVVIEVYVEQTRMCQLAMLVSFFLMWLFQKRNSMSKFVRIVVSVVGISIFIGLGFHNTIIESFSIDASINKNAASSIARINAISYFWGYFANNPIVGMGWVRPKNDSLRLIFSGPDGTAFFDDLGFLGQVFRQGILGALIYIFLVIRLIYILVKMGKDSPYRTLILGILVFLITSALSLNCFDGQRILGTAFFIALAEKVYHIEENNNDTDKSIFNKEKAI